MKKSIVILTSIFLLIGLFGTPLLSNAQEGLGGKSAIFKQSLQRERKIAGNTYGISDLTSHTLQAFAFEPVSATSDVTAASGYGSRYCTAECFYEAPLMIPSGALVVAIELDACDDDAINDIFFTLWEQNSPESGLTAAASGGTTDTPGCDFLWIDVTPPITADNFFNTYIVEVDLPGGTSDTRFQAVRVYYQLQISPPPGTATFGDVPTSHPFFQYVEALYDSGITAGCGGGNYCPDAPLTRGQMAVFLSKALGLHWPY